MAEYKDIQLDADGDLLFKDGDFVLGFSLDQEIEDVMVSAPGWYKLSPITGVNIRRWIDGPLTLQVRNDVQRAIRVQLEYDGMKVNKADIESWEQVIIDAQRN